MKNKNESIIKIGGKVRTYDEDDEKMVNGMITKVDVNSICIQWEDLSDPVKYELNKIEWDGNKLIEL